MERKQEHSFKSSDEIVSATRNIRSPCRDSHYEAYILQSRWTVGNLYASNLHLGQTHVKYVEHLDRQQKTWLYTKEREQYELSKKLERLEALKNSHSSAKRRATLSRSCSSHGTTSKLSEKLLSYEEQSNECKIHEDEFLLRLVKIEKARQESLNAWMKALKRKSLSCSSDEEKFERKESDFNSSVEDGDIQQKENETMSSNEENRQKSNDARLLNESSRSTASQNSKGKYTHLKSNELLVRLSNIEKSREQNVNTKLFGQNSKSFESQNIECGSVTTNKEANIANRLVHRESEEKLLKTTNPGTAKDKTFVPRPLFQNSWSSESKHGESASKLRDKNENIANAGAQQKVDEISTGFSDTKNDNRKSWNQRPQAQGRFLDSKNSKDYKFERRQKDTNLANGENERKVETMNHALYYPLASRLRLQTQNPNKKDQARRKVAKRYSTFSSFPPRSYSSTSWSTRRKTSFSATARFSDSLYDRGAAKFVPKWVPMTYRLENNRGPR